MQVFSAYVEVKDTGTSRGRGVFAARAFSAGEVVEVCPVLVVRLPMNELPAELRTRVFDWHVLADDPNPNAHALALGLGSVYNHDNPANMRYEALSSDDLLRFVAVRQINLGEELTINYNNTRGAPESREDVWFERMHVRRL